MSAHSLKIPISSGKFVNCAKRVFNWYLPSDSGLSSYDYCLLCAKIITSSNLAAVRDHRTPSSVNDCVFHIFRKTDKSVIDIDSYLCSSVHNLTFVNNYLVDKNMKKLKVKFLNIGVFSDKFREIGGVLFIFLSIGKRF